MTIDESTGEPDCQCRFLRKECSCIVTEAPHGDVTQLVELKSVAGSNPAIPTNRHDQAETAVIDSLDILLTGLKAQIDASVTLLDALRGPFGGEDP